MKHNKWIWVLLGLSLIGTMMVFPSLPEQIPTHWNSSNEIDDYSSKYMVFVTTLLPAVIYLSRFYLPKIDPKRENYLKHEKAYSIITISIVISLIAFHWIAILAVFNVISNIGFFVKVIIGALFIVLGNYMSQLRFNYFVGIKLPWTLSNEKVWRKTHRAGGLGFMLLGVIYIITAFITGTPSFIIFIISLIALLLFTTVYSYIQYQKELSSK